jgi:uncharacterized protein YkwD
MRLPHLALAAIAALALLLPAAAGAAQTATVAAAGDRGPAKGWKSASGEKPGDRARAAQAECEGADAAPSAGNLDAIRTSVLCLHNRIRARAGLPLLRENVRLRSAALAHSQDMVANRFFEHTAPSGATFVDRIMRARYVRGNEGWSLGENLAWGTGSYGTPQGVMDAWMNSPGHRRNVLRRSYREVGIGIVTGVPNGSSAGATYTMDFGVRR